MPATREKAKSVWLLSFGDMITLLITFFIMMIVLNKGEITHVQKWAEDELDKTSEILKSEMAGSEDIIVRRIPLGIAIDIRSDEAFLKGGFQPSEQLRVKLMQLGDTLKSVQFIAQKDGGMPQDISDQAIKSGLTLVREISIAGHTDNDKIDPQSSLRNNWFLSSMRAQNLMQLLYSGSGLEPDMFSVAGYGEYRPLVSNSSKANKSINRRVEIVISANFEHSENI